MPLEAVREVVAAGDMTPYRARMQHLGLGDGALGDPPLQTSPDDLDLGQLGHDIPCGNG
jgi:hypothetical protein